MVESVVAEARCHHLRRRIGFERGVNERGAGGGEGWRERETPPPRSDGDGLEREPNHSIIVHRMNIV
ncbi:unnamed protein product [Spirodela intermedia]|uniref:Uncharacterized protein n=1 Tax=Spirodela intermedia TaxID=51605 RepID=A0A7I8J4Y8_SPIIN|nr:unnamed protein product [Spirodela intermedia]CAA6665129.1 unnamed protein product [Spirodela intermedia]